MFIDLFVFTCNKTFYYKAIIIKCYIIVTICIDSLAIF